MWGRDKNFRLSMIFQLRNCKNKISLSQFFFTHPLYGITNLLVKQGSIVMINQEDVSNKVRLESLETWNNKQAEELNDCLLNLKS